MSRSTLIDHHHDVWLALPADHPDLLFAMSQKLVEVAGLARVERERAIAMLLDYEAGLPESELWTVIVAELRSLVALEHEDAAEIQRAIDTFLKSRPAEFSMRRISALQKAARDLSLEEISRLESLMPSIRAHAGLPPARATNERTEWSTKTAAPRRSRLSRMFSRP